MDYNLRTRKFASRLHQDISGQGLVEYALIMAPSGRIRGVGTMRGLASEINFWLSARSRARSRRLDCSHHVSRSIAGRIHSYGCALRNM